MACSLLAAAAAAVPEMVAASGASGRAGVGDGGWRWPTRRVDVGACSCMLTRCSHVHVEVMGVMGHVHVEVMGGMGLVHVEVMGAMGLVHVEVMGVMGLVHVEVMGAMGRVHVAVMGVIDDRGRSLQSSRLGSSGFVDAWMPGVAAGYSE